MKTTVLLLLVIISFACSSVTEPEKQQYEFPPSWDIEFDYDGYVANHPLTLNQENKNGTMNLSGIINFGEQQFLVNGILLDEALTLYYVVPNSVPRQIFIIVASIDKERNVFDGTVSVTIDGILMQQYHVKGNAVQ